MGYSAISQISQSFGNSINMKGKNPKPEALTRYYGGHSRTSHPYVNGYWQLFISPPDAMFSNSNISDRAWQWFHATAEGFTPPSRNLNKADLPGQGGVGSSWVTGQSLQRTFSITHREYRELPMAQIYQLWTSIIVPQYGVSEFSGTEWAGTTYKGHAFVIMTKPVGHTDNDWVIAAEDIEDAWYFDGVWPENQPWDSLAQDISANDIVQYTINFSFDGWPLNKTDPGVVEQAVRVLNSWQYHTTRKIYGDESTNDLGAMTQGNCPWSLTT